MNEEMNDGVNTETVGGGEVAPGTGETGTAEVKAAIELASRWKRLGGAVIDGTEVLAIYLSKKTGLTIGDIILIFNIIIFCYLSCSPNLNSCFYQ